MFEKFLSENWENFRQRYEGTYGFYRDAKGKRTLVRLESISERQVDFTSPHTTYNVRADAKEDVGFEFLPPKAGFHNTHLGAMLVSRVASRQFQRGISHRNITIHLCKSGTYFACNVDFKTLEMIYEQALAPKDALVNFDEQKVTSLAISPQLCLSIAPGTKKGLVYILADGIGTYTQKDKTFIVNLNDKSLFRTEVSDAIKALGREVTFT